MFFRILKILKKKKSINVYASLDNLFSSLGRICRCFFLSCWTTFHMIRHKISFHIWIYEFEFKIYAFHTKHILRLKPAKFVDNTTKLLGRLQTFIIDSKDNTIHFVSIKISTICNFFSEHLYKLFTPHFRSKGFVKIQRLLSNCLIA